ncbi:hypothetical protein Tco_0633427 [Tanacetum coccineum]
MSSKLMLVIDLYVADEDDDVIDYTQEPPWYDGMLMGSKADIERKRTKGLQADLLPKWMQRSSRLWMLCDIIKTVYREGHDESLQMDIPPNDGNEAAPPEPRGVYDNAHEDRYREGQDERLQMDIPPNDGNQVETGSDSEGFDGERTDIAAKKEAFLALRTDIAAKKVGCRNFVYSAQCKSLISITGIGSRSDIAMVHPLLPMSKKSIHSAGGLTSILHCDNFKALLPTSTRVKMPR